MATLSYYPRGLSSFRFFWPRRLRHATRFRQAIQIVVVLIESGGFARQHGPGGGAGSGAGGAVVRVDRSASSLKRQVPAGLLDDRGRDGCGLIPAGHVGAGRFVKER